MREHDDTDDGNKGEDMKILCKNLLERDKTLPQDSLFRDDLFKKTCEKVRNRNEATPNTLFEALWQDCHRFETGGMPQRLFNESYYPLLRSYDHSLLVAKRYSLWLRKLPGCWSWKAARDIYALETTRKRIPASCMKNDTSPHLCKSLSLT